VTAAYADVEIDIMGQVLVKFHWLVPEGFGSNAYFWNGDHYLRTDRAKPGVELLVAEDGYGYDLVVERQWNDVDDHLWDALIGASYSQADAEAAFRIIRDIVADGLLMAELTDDQIRYLNDLPISDPDVETVIAMRGRQTFVAD
jgi:hypothetical protein